MIEISTARELVEKELSQQSYNKSSDYRLVITHIINIENNLGWIFLYSTKAFVETRNPDYELYGNSPIIVDKEDGSLHYTGTGRSIEEYIKEFQQKKRGHL